MALALGAEAATTDDDGHADEFQAARVDVVALLDAVDMTPVQSGVRAPGPTRFGMHYWIDPELSGNPHGVHFVVVAVFPDTAEARAHYDALRARAGHPPLDAGEATRDRFAVRFNAGAGATDVTLTRGNVYVAFRGSGHRDDLAEIAADLLDALEDPAVAPQGAPAPAAPLTLTRRTVREGIFEIRARWGEDTGEALPRVVLFRPDGEYIAMADAAGVCEVHAERLATIETFLVVAGWPDNRWHSWWMDTGTIEEDATHE